MFHNSCKPGAALSLYRPNNHVPSQPQAIPGSDCLANFLSAVQRFYHMGAFAALTELDSKSNPSGGERKSADMSIYAICEIRVIRGQSSLKARFGNLQ